MEYLVKVSFSLFNTAYVQYINWNSGDILYTKNKNQAGCFESYSRACEIAEWLEREGMVASAEVIEA